MQAGDENPSAKDEWMIPKSSLPGLSFGGPATYRIVVQGSLDPTWSERLAGLAIYTVEAGDEATQTILFGRLRDQAELSGVLDTLYGLHLSILKVERIEEPP